MKNKTMLALLLLVLLTSSVTSSFGAELKPIWLTPACYQLKLSVYDKLSIKKNYIAKYIVRTADGEIYFAERAATASDVGSSEVIFPDSFRGERTRLQAYADCHYGQKYIWEIYADNVLVDSGTIEFTRKKRH